MFGIAEAGTSEVAPPEHAAPQLGRAGSRPCVHTPSRCSAFGTLGGYFERDPMSVSAPRDASFDTTLTAVGNNTGIEIPPDVVEALGAGKRPPLVVRVNGYEYRTTAGVMGGVSMIPVSAAIRKETGLAAGDAIQVELTVATVPRDVEVPGDFVVAIEAAGVRSFYDALSNSLQRYHVDQVNGAKTEETRLRRIDKAVELFRRGKQR